MFKISLANVTNIKFSFYLFTVDADLLIDRLFVSDDVGLSQLLHI